MPGGAGCLQFSNPSQGCSLFWLVWLQCQAPLYLTLYREAWTCANESAWLRLRSIAEALSGAGTWNQAVLLATG